jgi:hypothetical protein
MLPGKSASFDCSKVEDYFGAENLECFLRFMGV